MKTNYEKWTPLEGDYNKRNLARDSYIRKKKEKQEKHFKLVLFTLYSVILIGSLIYFL